MTIHYLKGDATHPACDDHRVIVHICNDLGKWTKGVNVFVYDFE